MHWHKAWVCGLILMGLLGCMRTFGPGGSIKRALKKDQQGLLNPPVCPPRNELEELCEDEDDERCPLECLEQ